MRDQTYINENFDEIVAEVRKPGRYIGGEVNAIVKEYTEDTVSFAFAFADLYEIGMCHVGLQILYAVLNAEEGVVCERVFTPAPDFESRLRERAVPLFSLETRRPLGAFDFLGFSFQYELQYTNMLTMMSLAGIPLWATEREHAGYEGPLVLAGGPCMLNPEPIAPFVDIVIIGDAEEVLPRLVREYAATEKRVAPDERRAYFFDAISHYDGVYIPSRQSARADASGLVVVGDRAKSVHVRKSVLRDLNELPYSVAPIVPIVRTVHDRATVEVMRGCPRQCKFCQARHTYWPVRKRDADMIKKTAREIISNTGFNEISLQSLSIGDYPCIESVLSELHDELAAERVSLSFPSLRIEKILKIFTMYATKVRKTGLTFAVEAATQELRDRIGKDIDVSLIFEIFRAALDRNCDTVKLYFMIGLPGETMDDVRNIMTFVDSLLELARDMKKKRVKINLGVSTFIPKPHTDFEREILDEQVAIEEKQEFLRAEGRKRRNIKVGLTDYAISKVEAMLARGDRGVADVVHAAWRAGARLDAWQEHFSSDIWMTVMDAYPEKTELCLYTRVPEEYEMPWDFIDVKPSSQ